MKRDISKLRGREIYKIVSLYRNNSDDMATIRKSDDKFMAKDYEIKLAEIFPMKRNVIKEPETFQ